MIAGNERSGARRLIAEARDMAQAVGETTVNTARGLAAGARDAATGVASRTGETATQVAGQVWENKWPALLIGAGATWLVVDAVRGRSESGRRGGGRHRRGNRRGTRNFAGRALTTVADASRNVGGRVEQFVRDNPFVAGATTLGMGIAVGMALPTTDVENALLGNARESVVRRARDAARGAVAESVARVTGR